MTNYKIEIAKREIESELLAKVKAEINAEYPDTDDDFDINDWMYHLELNKLATSILKYRIPVPTPRQKYNSVVVDIDNYINEFRTHEEKYELTYDELPPWSEINDIDDYINELPLQEENDELPSWSEIIDIDDHIDELETEEFYESLQSDTDNCELITIDEIDEWERSIYWEHGTELQEYLRLSDVGGLEQWADENIIM